MNVNTSHRVANEVYINCSISFTGLRGVGGLLIRLPISAQRTQYITVSKNGTASYMTNIAAGSTDINCPVAFNAGDNAYITGIITAI